MSLASLRDVYNPMIPKPESKPPLQNWKESIPVILLSEYLRIHKAKGISLCQSWFDGEPCLHFNPPLSKKDQGNSRWDIAENAFVLLLDASDDLRELIASGLIKLPVSYHTKAAGPSGASNVTRVAKPQSSNTFRV